VDSVAIDPFRERLRAGAAELAVALSEGQVEALLAYARLLDRWGRAYNLTAVRGLEAIVVRHLLDSLALAPFIAGERFLDVGTGAGLPGLVLAVAAPVGRWTLLDSGGKKANFCRHAVMELGLPGVEVVQARIEDYHPLARFDRVTARAWGRLAALLGAAAPLLSPEGAILAPKGAYPGAELAEVEPGGWRLDVHRLRVPGLDAERHLVVARRSADAPVRRT
jgi:16S rRNA (guanine527-N7)-methyltransferase